MDDDMIVGSVHTTCYIETLYWLDKCGYNGWLSMDQYPYREDAVLQENRTKIDSLIKLNDAVETSRFLRSVLI